MTWTPPPDIDVLIPELVATRRDLHRHPELGYEEHRTSERVASRLSELGFQVTRGLGKTGVVGRWPAAQTEGPTIAFRADMDALPIQEENTCDYASATPGIMHACGHDGHVAILLGFARWLSQAPPLPGNVVLIFQPAEEGGGGAVPLIEAGVLDNPPVSAIFGLHLWSQVQVGAVGVKSGPFMAAADQFRIEVLGKGGHGAMPHQTTDAVLAAAQIVCALQNIVARRIDPQEAAVISVGTLHAGTAGNIIAERAEMQGTARSFLPEIRDSLPGLVEESARHAAAGLGARTTLDWERGYPPLFNHPRESDLVRRAAVALLGEAPVLEGKPTMGAEDMAYYLEKVPGCFFWLGAGNPEKGIDKPHHNPRFDIDEDALPLGVALFARIAREWFAEQSR